MWPFTRKPKQDWRLVCSIVHPDTVSYDKISGEVFYHLFESDIGNRAIQLRCSLKDAPQDKLDEHIKASKFYHTKIYRWLAGRGDPEILRYSEVDQEETAHALKGKINDTLKEKFGEE